MDWNNWTITTAQLSSGTAMFLWNSSTGALHLWTEPGLQPGHQPAHLHAVHALDQLEPRHDAEPAGRRHQHRRHPRPLDRRYRRRPTTAWLVTVQAGSATITAQPSQTLITADHAWQLNDKFDEAGDGVLSTAADISGGKSHGVEVTERQTGVSAKWRQGELFPPDVG